jgi:hypothetical protein
MSEKKFGQIQEQEGTKAVQGMSFDKKELYKQLRLMGYEYGGLFQGISKRSKTGKTQKGSKGRKVRQTWTTLINIHIECGKIHAFKESIFFLFYIVKTHCSLKSGNTPACLIPTIYHFIQVGLSLRIGPCAKILSHWQWFPAQRTREGKRNVRQSVIRYQLSLSPIRALLTK